MQGYCFLSNSFQALNFINLIVFNVGYLVKCAMGLFTAAMNVYSNLMVVMLLEKYFTAIFLLVRVDVVLKHTVTSAVGLLLNSYSTAALNTKVILYSLTAKIFLLHPSFCSLIFLSPKIEIKIKIRFMKIEGKVYLKTPLWPTFLFIEHQKLMENCSAKIIQKLWFAVA